MFEERAQSYRVKDKEIYRVKLACQNTKVYRVNTQLTKGTITLIYFFCFFLHMRTLSVLDKYRANVLGPCRARAITLFTVFPWRFTFSRIKLQRHCMQAVSYPYENVWPDNNLILVLSFSLKETKF